MKFNEELEKAWNPYNSMMLKSRFKILCSQAYSRFPKRVKKKIFRYHLLICDYMYHSKYPDRDIVGMPYGFYHEGKGLIDIVPEEANKLSDNAFIGFIAHETAHFYADKTIKLIKKLKSWFYKIKFNSLSEDRQKFYRNPEELHADILAVKWGFIKEINTINQERIVKADQIIIN